MFVERAVVTMSVLGGFLGLRPVVRASGEHLGSRALTSHERRLVTTVLDRIIPADGNMPSAGEVGVASFIDDVVQKAPHLRGYLDTVLFALPDSSALARMSDRGFDDLIQSLRPEQRQCFDALIHATYIGYYSDPSVLARIACQI